MITSFSPRLIATILLTGVSSILVNGQGTISLPSGKNLAVVASQTSSSRSGASMTSLNDGLIPNNTGSMRSGGNRPPQRPTAQWVQYEWTQPVSTREIAVFWWNYENTVRLPQAYRIKYWNGNDFVPVKNATGLGLVNNLFNISTFDLVQTTQLRMEVDSVDRFLGTMLEWMVFQSDNSPNHPPVVTSGVDRSVMLGGKTYLSGGVKSVTPYNKITWSKVSGPGNVNFADANSIKTTAIFSLSG
ncbi:MAG: Tat pathway signal protein, partial [Thermoplasmata archaeon]|nr:Tat pathway signal protein [Thermoplasmata archaeon]